LFFNGYIFQQVENQFYCEKCSLFLPDRYIIGVCPICASSNARGDQCSNNSCRSILSAEELGNPKCFHCLSSPEIKQTSQWFFNLPKLSKKLKNFLRNQVRAPKATINEALSILEQKLKPRAITRDLSWGIPVKDSLPDTENKVFYVWAEDVLGYISASIPVLGAKWEEIWTNLKTRTVFCLGLDNIFFHALWFPALLLASSKPFVLPYTLCVTNFIQFEGQAFSKSKGIGIWIDEAVAVAPTDYWRFYLILNRPEGKGSNFTWKDFVNNINKELIDTLGNLVHRLVKFIWRFQEGKVYRIIRFDEIPQNNLINQSKERISKIENFIYRFELRKALNNTLLFVKAINAHLSKQEPWKVENKRLQNQIIGVSYLALIKLTYLIEPVIPQIALEILQQLGKTKFEILNQESINEWTIKENISILEPQFFLKHLSEENIQEKLQKYRLTKKE
jgi:methionyl-tRNA synthetase